MKLMRSHDLRYVLPSRSKTSPSSRDSKNCFDGSKIYVFDGGFATHLTSGLVTNKHASFIFGVFLLCQKTKLILSMVNIVNFIQIEIEFSDDTWLT